MACLPWVVLSDGKQKKKNKMKCIYHHIQYVALHASDSPKGIPGLTAWKQRNQENITWNGITQIGRFWVKQWTQKNVSQLTKERAISMFAS